MTVLPQHINSKGSSFSTTFESSNLFDHIRYLMILRVVIITTFMVVSLPLLRKTEVDNIFWLEAEKIIWFLVSLIIFLYFLTIIYSLLLYRIKNLRTFAYFQITGDILFETGLIYISGPIFSPLVFLYIISIITAGIMLSTPGTYIIASLSCIAYGTLSALSQNAIIPPLNIFGYSELSFTTGTVLYKLFVNFCSFYLVAYLSNHLIKNLRRAGEELGTKEEDLIRLQKLNENILRSIDSGLFSVDLQGNIATFNYAAERITGFTSQEVVGKKVDTFFPNNIFDDAFSQNEPNFNKRIEQAFITKQNMKVFLGFTFSNLYDEHGEITGYIVIFQDLTDFKKLETAKKRAEKMAILGELAARMAHEIRNPLTAMKGSIEIISKEQAIQSSNKKLLEIILRESDRLNRLISDFLQYAQPRKLISKQFSLTILLKETIILLQNHPKMNAKISIVSKIPEDEYFIFGDMFQIKQVILNLCLNGIDAMPTGGTLSIYLADSSTVTEAHRLKPDVQKEINQDNTVAIMIKDTGEGIPAKNSEQIFTPFFSTKESGTGLGLAIAYRIVEYHNGIIDYITEENKGTTFFILLPKREYDKPEDYRMIEDEQYISR